MIKFLKRRNKDKYEILMVLCFSIFELNLENIKIIIKFAILKKFWNE